MSFDKLTFIYLILDCGQTDLDAKVLEADNENSSQRIVPEEPGSDSATWGQFLMMWITLSNLIGGIIYRFFRARIISVTRSTENIIVKFIIYPLFSLWYPRRWLNRDPRIKQNIKKLSHNLMLAFFIVLSVWINAYINPGFQYINTFNAIVNSISELVTPFLSISNIYNQFKFDASFLTFLAPYQFYIVLGMDQIKRHLIYINFQLKKQDQINMDIASNLNAYHDKIEITWQVIKANQDSISQKLRETTDELTQQIMLRIDNNIDDLILSPRFLNWLYNTKFFKELAQQEDEKIATKYFFDGFKRFIVDGKQLASDHLDSRVDPTSYNHTLDKDGVTVFYGKNTSLIPPMNLVLFNYLMLPWVEFTASDAIRRNDDCWSFTSATGTLGIRLSGTANIKYISIKCLDADTAPKAFELEAITDFFTDLRFTYRGTVPLGEFEFRNNEPDCTQRFRVKYKGPVKAMFVKIKTNWGSKETNICKIGIYSHNI
jgi:hypothetical protein